jgi:hypothetical protein
MQFASICIMAEHLVQTRVPTAVAKGLARRAEAEGETVAGWVRRLLAREHAKAHVQAWVRPTTMADPAVFLYDPPAPDYVLELLTQLSGPDTLFSVLDARTGRVWSDDACLECDWFKRASEHRWILRGNPFASRLLSGRWNSTSCRLEIVLRTLGEHDS